MSKASEGAGPVSNSGKETGPVRNTGTSDEKVHRNDLVKKLRQTTARLWGRIRGCN